MSLQTGASLITLALLLNKVSGLYGLLVVLTGFHLSPFQLSMYIYSVIALVLSASLAPHIQKQSPLQCLVLAWFYLIDSVVNAAYTAVFSVTWFIFISQHHNSAPTSGPGSTMDDAAGFTNPRYNVSAVHVAPESGVASAQSAGAPAGTADDPQGNPSLENGVLQPESLQSIAIISTLWAIRIYFVVVMLAFARQCLRLRTFNRLTSTNSHPGTVSHTRDSSVVSPPRSRSPSVVSNNVALDMNPFSTRFPEGQGWKGRFGRVMVAVGKSFWLEGDNDDDSWTLGMNRKFHTNRDTQGGGLNERERRRRAGTGPPAPSKDVLNSAPSPSSSQNPYQNAAGGQSAKVYDSPDERERGV